MVNRVRSCAISAVVRDGVKCGACDMGSVRWWDRWLLSLNWKFLCAACGFGCVAVCVGVGW